MVFQATLPEMLARLLGRTLKHVIILVILQHTQIRNTQTKFSDTNGGTLVQYLDISST